MTDTTRHIRVFIDAEEQLRLHETIGQRQELDRALGYFAQWGLGSMRYKYLRIYSTDRRTAELLAVYNDSEDAASNTFVIGAVWDDAQQRYSFNS